MVILIAHRGNLKGPDPEVENRPEQIDLCIGLGFHVEIDLRYIDDSFYLGHDYPDHHINEDYLLARKDSLYCHAKDLAALRRLLEMKMKCFFHDTDAAVLTSDGMIWCYPGQRSGSSLDILVMPERVDPEFGSLNSDLKICRGICTDYPLRIKNNFLNQ